MKNGFWVILIFLLSCSSDRAVTFKPKIIDGKIDLSSQIVGNWDKVCILGPYTLEPNASEILGFESDVLDRSDISGDDTITLLVVLQGQSITGLYEVPRGHADFTKLGSGCFNRKSAKFKVASNA